MYVSFGIQNIYTHTHAYACTSTQLRKHCLTSKELNCANVTLRFMTSFVNDRGPT